MNFSFKSLFAIWSLSPQQFHYYFPPSIVSWQYQKYSTILILVLCLLCVTPLVCSSYSSFAPSSPFFSSWWQKLWVIYTYTCSPMFSIDIVASAPDDPSSAPTPPPPATPAMKWCGKDRSPWDGVAGQRARPTSAGGSHIEQSGTAVYFAPQSPNHSKTDPTGCNSTPTRATSTRHHSGECNQYPVQNQPTRLDSIRWICKPLGG